MSKTRVHRILDQVGTLAFAGVFDTLSAKLAQQVGFPMAFVSGYSVAATAIGEPDMGLLTQTEITDRARHGLHERRFTDHQLEVRRSACVPLCLRVFVPLCLCG